MILVQSFFCVIHDISRIFTRSALFFLISEFHNALHVGGQQGGGRLDSREIATNRPQIQTPGVQWLQRPSEAPDTTRCWFERRHQVPHAGPSVSFSNENLSLSIFPHFSSSPSLSLINARPQTFDIRPYRRRDYTERVRVLEALAHNRPLSNCEADQVLTSAFWRHVYPGVHLKASIFSAATRNVTTHSASIINRFRHNALAR